jgi:hypothetical protein
VKHTERLEMVFAVLGFGFQQVALDKKIRDEIFPTKEEMPEIDMKWAVRGKAMHILRHRTIEEGARAQFRQSCPPCYLCPRCQAVFSFEVIAREHKLSCLYVKDAPQHLS